MLASETRSLTAAQQTFADSAADRCWPIPKWVSFRHGARCARLGRLERLDPATLRRRIGGKSSKLFVGVRYAAEVSCRGEGIETSVAVEGSRDRRRDVLS